GTATKRRVAASNRYDDMSSAVMQERPQTLARATEGDANSFAILLEPLLDPAYRLAAVMLGDRSAAEDAVQEASIKAWRKLRQLRGEVGSLRSWFLSIVANECRMARRQRWWSVVRLPDIRTAAEAGAMSDAPATDLKAALLRLSPDEPRPARSRPLEVDRNPVSRRSVLDRGRRRGDDRGAHRGDPLCDQPEP